MSTYIARHDDLVIQKAHAGRTTGPKVYRVEIITSGKAPVGIYDAAGGDPTHRLWTVTDMAGSALYSIALVGGGAARRGYPRRGLPVITRAEAADHIVNGRA